MRMIHVFGFAVASSVVVALVSLAYGGLMASVAIHKERTSARCPPGSSPYYLRDIGRVACLVIPQQEEK